jgi:hypothetical protein
MTVFWHVLPCITADTDRRLGGQYLQGIAPRKAAMFVPVAVRT